MCLYFTTELSAYSSISGSKQELIYFCLIHELLTKWTNNASLYQFHILCLPDSSMLSFYEIGERRTISASKNPIVAHSRSLKGFWNVWLQRRISGALEWESHGWCSCVLSAHKSRVWTCTGALLQECHAQSLQDLGGMPQNWESALDIGFREDAVAPKNHLRGSQVQTFPYYLHQVLS